MTARLEGLEELMRSIEETGKRIDRNAEAKALQAGGEFLQIG
jgi:hypothetical protein